MKTTLTRAAIILADIPYTEYNPHQHHGKHYYVIVSNEKACTYSPVVQAIPMSSNIKRHLPVQIEVQADCFSRRTFALAEQMTLLPRTILEEGKYCGQMPIKAMDELQKAIKRQLALD
ncbi:MAG: type II toxin-antitoxin system PemK/MazF family toxin [Bacteroidaceae bacterium]|nr:type II toxin-antitoxin system PemK/MazF family toxin [Bacteroidaceae bacterium]MBQ5664498.1 type II toxin-antitoxin system PemK/MazF family toxin [Akkermansia sp.]